MGVITLILSALIPFAWNVIEGGVKGATEREIFTQGQYVADRITYEIRNASDINSVSSTQISLANANSATNPTIIYVSGGKVNIQQGSATPFAINSQNTTIQSFNFTNYSSSDNKTKNIQFVFTIAANYPGTGTRQEYNGSVTMEGSAEVRSN
jgi:hypothetical protein